MSDTKRQTFGIRVLLDNLVGKYPSNSQKLGGVEHLRLARAANLITAARAEIGLIPDGRELAFENFEPAVHCGERRSQSINRRLLLTNCLMLLLNLIEKHRRKKLIHDALRLPVLVAYDEIGIDRRHFFGDEAVL